MSVCNGCKNLVSIIWLARREEMKKGKNFYDCADASNDVYIGAFNPFEDIPKPFWCPKSLVLEGSGFCLRKVIDLSGDNVVKNAMESGVKFVRNEKKERKNKER